MGLYTETIQDREKNNHKLEKAADRSLLEDRHVPTIEDEVDDAQTTLLYILKRFGITTDRLFGFYSIPPLLDTILDPLGMMYDYEKDTAAICKKRTEFILAFREDGKSVALIPTRMGYRYYCPGDASSGHASKAFCSKLKKGCYVIHHPLAIRKTVFRTFVYNVLHMLRLEDILRLLIASGLVTLLGLVTPAVNRYIYKTYIPEDHSMHGFIVALTICLFVIVIRALISMTKTFLLSSTKIRVSMQMQSSVMAKILHLPYSFFQDTSSGKISRRINSCTRLSDTVLEIALDVMLDLAFSIAYLFQMHSIASELFLPALILIAINILFSMFSSFLNMVNETRLLDLDMEYTGFLFSSIKGVQKIKGLGAETFIFSKWADMYRKRLALTYKQPFFLKYSDEIMAALRIITTIVFLSVALKTSMKNTDYMTFTSSFTLIMTVVTSLTDIMENLFLTKLLIKNIAPVFDAPIAENETLEYIHNLQGEIKAEDIFYSYDDDTRGCLNGITIHIKRGEKVAIVGESGCGKSTLLKILLGLIVPDSGDVYYDEKSIHGLNLKSLRRCIGSVFQFSRLFPGTIADNIAFGKEDLADDDMIWEAADAAVIGDAIRALPLQMNTEISESNSGGFSGGERQRLLLARAFLGHPDVLILDEATSALDNVSQRTVLEHIRKMSATVIMVAHRLSTVESFDRIIMLENGKIAEEGTYSELMAKDGHFAQLVRKQLLQSTKKSFIS